MTEFISTALLENLVNTFTKPIKEQLAQKNTDQLDTMKSSLDLCFTRYLERYYKKYSKTKTLLYKDQPVDIKKLYIQTDFRINDINISEKQFFEILFERKRIVITGSAGVGKSTFCKSLFLETIEKDIGIFPIFVELRHLNEEKKLSLQEYITNTLVEMDSRFTKEQLENSLKLGKTLIILDGFDEISALTKDKYEKEIIRMSNKYNNVLFIIASRPDERFSAWDEFSTLKVQPLDKEKALSLILKLDCNIKIKREFLDELNNELFYKHESFSSTPLLLTIMLLTFEQTPNIQNKIHLFYEQAFLTLFNKHDSTKSLYNRNLNTNLPLDDFKKILSSFCIISYSEKKYFFTENEILNYLEKSKKLLSIKYNSGDYFSDLLDGVCILKRDGLGYSFRHKSFQEYFSALFITNFISDKSYDLIENITYNNTTDSVISMAYEINKDFIENKWIMPKLQDLDKKFGGTLNKRYGKLEVLSHYFNYIVLTNYSKKNEANYIPEVGFSGEGANLTDLQVIWKISSLYRNEDDFSAISKNNENRKNKDAFSEIYYDNIHIFSEENNRLDIRKFNELSDKTKNLLNSNFSTTVVGHIIFLLKKHQDLLRNNESKRTDIHSILSI